MHLPVINEITAHLVPQTALITLTRHVCRTWMIHSSLWLHSTLCLFPLFSSLACHLRDFGLKHPQGLCGRIYHSGDVSSDLHVFLSCLRIARCGLRILLLLCGECVLLRVTLQLAALFLFVSISLRFHICWDYFNSIKPTRAGALV